MQSSLPAATSVEIASAADLDERYVREWLGAMTTGGIVEHDAAAETFALPTERAAWLTRAAGPDNLAVQAQYIALMALVEDRIVDCFHHGGGVPYSEFPKFQRLMAEDSGAVQDATLLDITLPLLPRLIVVTSRSASLRSWRCSGERPWTTFISAKQSRNAGSLPSNAVATLEARAAWM